MRVLKQKGNNNRFYVTLGVLIIIIIGLSIAIIVRNTSWNIGGVANKYHIVKNRDNTYYIIDGKYDGEYDIQEGYLDFSDFEANTKIIEKFNTSRVMNYKDYAEYCKKWSITQKYSNPRMNYAIVAYASMYSVGVDVELAHVETNNSTAKLFLRDDFQGVVADTVYYILIVPVEQNITSLEVISLINEEEYQDILQHSALDDRDNIIYEKPIIYLYPTTKTEISVKLGNPKNITTIYPSYHDGWRVLAEPDGVLTDLSTGRELYSLYYESRYNKLLRTNEGFVVKGIDAAAFLEEKLAMLGLSEREAEEFIIYWLPKLESHPYNYIRFASLEEISNDVMPLSISPKPDSLIRVLMVFEGLDEPVSVIEQKLVSPQRSGFTVVEWGGTEIKHDD